MRKAVYILLILLTGLPGLFAQTNAVVKSLFPYEQPVATISWDGYKYLNPVDEQDPQFENFSQCLIRNNKGLYAYINGTGRLYRAFLKNGVIQFVRIDSTVYFGSNFGSFAFSYKDTIYSLGGYGFWKTNGLLRYFVEKRKEWEIIKLNMEIPFLTGKDFDLIWYDQAAGKLFFGFTREENSTTTEEKSKISFHYETRALDLNQKKWAVLGNLSGFLKSNLNDIYNITSSPWGQMISLNKRTYFLDYRQNNIYQLSADKQKMIDLLSTATGDVHVFYFKDSVFFSGIHQRNLLDSIFISRNDLSLVNEKIYTNRPEDNLAKNVTNNNIISILSLLVVLIVVLLWWLQKKYGNKSNKLRGRDQPVNHNIFSDQEKQVLKAITSNSQNGKPTSIEEINRVIGVSRKSIEIQKKQRSDIISAINKKYSYLNSSEGELIVRKQTEFDKRSFEYFIDYNKLSYILPFIKDV